MRISNLIKLPLTLLQRKNDSKAQEKTHTERRKGERFRIARVKVYITFFARQFLVAFVFLAFNWTVLDYFPLLRRVNLAQPIIIYKNINKQKTSVRKKRLRTLTLKLRPGVSGKQIQFLDFVIQRYFFFLFLLKMGGRDILEYWRHKVFCYAEAGTWKGVGGKSAAYFSVEYGCVTVQEAKQNRWE